MKKILLSLLLLSLSLEAEFNIGVPKSIGKQTPIGISLYTKNP